MIKKLRDWLRDCLRLGFWFPPLCRSLKWSREHASLARCFERWLAAGGVEPLGAPEFYQAALLTLLLLWSTAIARAPLELFRSWPFRLGATLLLVYWTLELLIFAMHWIFVAEGRLASARRSLAMFLLNVVQLALLMRIAMTLTPTAQSGSGVSGCSDTASAPTVAHHLRSIFKLEVIRTSPDSVCQGLAYLEMVTAGALLLIVVAGLVGVIVRADRVQQPAEPAMIEPVVPLAEQSVPLSLRIEDKVQALLARFQDHTTLLRTLTSQDFQILGGYLTIQLGLAAWLADHPPTMMIQRVGIAAIDLPIAMLAAMFLYGDYRRRLEVRDSLLNVLEALQFNDPGAYVSGRSLDVPTRFHSWWRWYLIAIAIGAVAIAVLLFGPPIAPAAVRGK